MYDECQKDAPYSLAQEFGVHAPRIYRICEKEYREKMNNTQKSYYHKNKEKITLQNMKKRTTVDIEFYGYKTGYVRVKPGTNPEDISRRIAKKVYGYKGQFFALRLESQTQENYEIIASNYSVFIGFSSNGGIAGGNVYFTIKH